MDNTIISKMLKLNDKIKDNYIKVIIMLIIIILFLYFWIFDRKKINFYFDIFYLFFKHEIYILYENLKSMYHNNIYYTLLILFINQILVIIFFIPIHTLLCILNYFVIKNDIVYFLIIYFSSNLASLIVYLISNYILKKKIKNKLKGYEIYDIIKNKIRNNSYLYSLWCKFLYIPLGVKEYLLSVIFNFKHYFFGCLLFYFYETLQYLLICKEIDSFKEFLYNLKQKNINNFNWVDIFTLIFLSFSFFISFYVGYWLKNNFSLNKSIYKI